MPDYVIMPRKTAERISAQLTKLAAAVVGSKPKNKGGRPKGRKTRKARADVPASLAAAK